MTSGILFANSVYDDGYDGYYYPTDLLYFHFLKTVSDYEIDSVMNALGCELVDSLYGDHFVRIARLSGDSPTDVVSAGNRAYETGLFSLAKATFASNWETFDTPNDEFFIYQWYLKNDGSGGGTADADIDFDLSLDYYIPTTPFTVGIVDEGFEGHPDLPVGRIVGGWDYYHLDPDITPGQYMAHGMSCAGILTANTDNYNGVAGLTGYNVQIVGQKIFADRCPDVGSCAASNVMIALALDSCRIKGAKVVSNSWGRRDNYPPAPEIDEAIARCDSAGVCMVFAAGNGSVSWVGHPACQPEAIAVGATNRSDQKWYYSQYGSEIDVVAPSGACNLTGDIWTLDRVGTPGYNPAYITCDPQNIDYDCKFGGTSAACPQVAGIIARLMLRRPDLIGDTDRIRRIVRLSSERSQYGVNDTVRVNNQVGWGRVNADRALLAIVRGDCTNDGIIDIEDVIYLIEYIGAGGPAPLPRAAVGDANCRESVDIDDVVYLIQYLYAGGPEPPDCFDYTNYDPD